MGRSLLTPSWSGSSPSAVLVLGAGAQNPRSLLGQAVMSLDQLMGRVLALDPTEAAAACLAGSLQDVIDWIVSVHGVDEVVVVNGEGDVPPTLPDRLAAAVHVVTPDDALALLNLRATTAATEQHRAPALQARDRGPRVSALLTAHNHERYVDAAMQSLLEQETDLEVVVVDDGSTDGTLAALRQYESDPRVTVLEQPNIGHTGLLDLVCNRVVRAARGDLICWLSTDDVAEPGRVAAQVEAFDEDPLLAVCHSAGTGIGPADEVLGSVWGLPRAYDELSLLRDLVQGNFIGSPGSMIRRSALHQVGLYSGGYVCDYTLWLSMARTSRFRYLPRRLTRYRLHEESLSNSEGGRPVAEREALRVRSELLARSALEDLYPELALVDDPEVRQAAWVDMGNRLVTEDPASALIAYENALATGPTPAASYNSAVAHIFLDDVRAATRAARAAAAADPSSEPLLSALLNGTSAHLALRDPSPLLELALETTRAVHFPDVRRWDGTALSQHRAYAAVDLRDRGLGAAAVTSWSRRTSSSDPVRWVVPDRGRGIGPTLAALAVWADGADLSRAGEIVIEAVDDLQLLPPEETRPTGALGSAQDVAALVVWANQFATSQS